MSEFSIHDVKTVEELYDMNDVNRYLQSGWVLLSVGFNTVDEETEKVYIVPFLCHSCRQYAIFRFHLCFLKNKVEFVFRHKQRTRFSCFS